MDKIKRCKWHDELQLSYNAVTTIYIMKKVKEQLNCWSRSSIFYYLLLHVDLKGWKKISGIK